MWKSGNWVKYETKAFPLVLRLHYDQLLITMEEKVIESLNINSKLKGIFKDDVLILIISVIGQEVRKIKFQIKENVNQCLQKLGLRFPVLKFGSEPSRKKFKGKYRNVEDILKKTFEVKDSLHTSITPAEYKNFVKLSLLDPLFPQLVIETEDIVNEYLEKTDRIELFLALIMMSNRYTLGQSSIRKSRLEGKPSLLPKPRRPGSSDRLSTETRRPSAAGHRSSSADPPRGTFGPRLSREASATKLPVNGRSRSQTGDAKYGAATSTPLRVSHYRSTTTPQRTPSEDRLNRDWKTCLERALAFVTIKDQRPISNVAWQRSECARVGEALAKRESSMALIRPLTITRFVDTVGALLTAITKDAKLNNDNYVTKLPHLSKRVLYPGPVSKSWLRTVNTLHAFPHALALVAYLLDLVTHIESPVEDDWLYISKDDLSCLRRDYLYKCWIRPISNVAWQRSECARVGEALAKRESSMALIRPLTITRFVDTVGALLTAITKDAKLNNDNYVTKLPHLSKRVLYPGPVSKSWLRTVNTLHAFPHALALVAYLLDLVTHIESPVEDDWLYISKDDLSCLRRDYLYKCWIRFQHPGHQFEDLNEEYLVNLKSLLGNDEEKIKELEQVILKYSACLNDEAEAAARAEVARREERDTRAASEALRAEARDADQEAKMIDADVDRISAELERVTSDLESQVMSREQRARLLDDLDYAVRVHDSKRTLADEIQKMVSSKETELALWQKKTLESCGEYRQRLIHLAGLPALNALAIDENSLMGAECVSLVTLAVDTLREEASRLSAKKNELLRTRSALARKRTAMMEEARSKIGEVAATVEREQKSLEGEREREAEEVRKWTKHEGETRTRLQELEHRIQQYRSVADHLAYWEDRDGLWRSKLSELKEYIEQQKIVMQKRLEQGRARRAQLVEGTLRLWREKLGGNSEIHRE
ncbi:kinetochore protein NDC80 [Danaus plexippus plexippus]|uniref:Kinetochore protein NDC80 n=1 Tax=Danaus plexippus plexippus TaxID=278856 RepID=A0A212EWU8_DANPL|nr:kinetochore protein NDC80 [Danaus plexippus plexippus]